MVFVFFGLVAVLGTTYVQTESFELPALYAAVGVGAFACAILVANNLRDIPTDTVSGKRTLAVALGDERTRHLYGLLIDAAVVALVGVALTTTWWVAARAGRRRRPPYAPRRTVLGEKATGPGPGPGAPADRRRRAALRRRDLRRGRGQPGRSLAADVPADAPRCHTGAMWFLILLAIVAVCALAYTNRVTLLAKVLGQSETRINRQLKRKPR